MAIPVHSHAESGQIARALPLLYWVREGIKRILNARPMSLFCMMLAMEQKSNRATCLELHRESHTYQRKPVRQSLKAHHELATCGDSL